MGRTITGSAMISWALLVIPANMGLPGYEADLCFGFFLLILGSILIATGVESIRRQHGQTVHGRPENETVTSRRSSAEPSPSGTSAAQRIAEGVFTGVVSGGIVAVLTKVLGV